MIPAGRQQACENSIGKKEGRKELAAATKANKKLLMRKTISSFVLRSLYRSDVCVFGGIIAGAMIK